MLAFGGGEFIVPFARMEEVFFGVEGGGEVLFFLLFRFQSCCLSELRCGIMKCLLIVQGIIQKRDDSATASYGSEVMSRERGFGV